MSDTDFLLRVLEQANGWLSHDEIVRRSQFQRGHGLTVHSRAADLRKRGYVVEVDVKKSGSRRTSFYRIGALESAPDTPVDVDGSFLPSLSGADSSASVNPGRSLGESTAAGAHTAGAADPLTLFACTIDESAGMRGAYSEGA